MGKAMALRIQAMNPCILLLSSYTHRGIGKKREGMEFNMRIAILGAGAMGMLFGGRLSEAADVTLIDTDETRVNDICGKGITIAEKDGSEIKARPRAVTSPAGMEPVDLIIVFVKSMHTAGALEQNRDIIGSGTYVMTLQNGAGHDNAIRKFVPEDRIIIGTTQHNSSVKGLAEVFHGGGGQTYIGLISGDTAPLESVRAVFDASGFETEISSNIHRNIWNKLFLNASASALTAVLQVKMGYLVDNGHAWEITERLAREAVAVANAKDLDFDADTVIRGIRTVLENAREGYTSIFADIRDGRKTEVDTISGYVTKEARALGVPSPTLECIVSLIHAMEERR
jgi:2-dehydropantoate 2-reductase